MGGLGGMNSVSASINNAPQNQAESQSMVGAGTLSERKNPLAVFLGSINASIDSQPRRENHLNSI